MTETHRVTAQGYRKCRVSLRCGPQARAIAQRIMNREGLSWEDIRGDSVTRDVTRVRHEIFSALFDTGVHSMPEIARFTGRRHHTTVLQGIRSYEGRARQ